MSNKILLSLAMVGLFAATAKATTVESTTSWFEVDASSVDLSTNWGTVKPTRETSATVIDVDTDAANPAKYTPAELIPSATRYRVTGNMKVTLNAGAPSAYTGTLPKAALVAVDASGTGKWYAWHLTSESAGEWVEMTTEDAPAEGNTYAVAIEFTRTTVSYIVGGTTLGTAESSGATKTLANAGGLSIASVGLAGYGSFGDFGAVGYEEFEVVVPASTGVDAAKYEALIANMEIGEGDIATELNTKGENHLTKWQSAVLGLATSATEPYTAPVQVPDEGGKTYLGFKIGNANAADYGVSGSAATFTVYECDVNGNLVAQGATSSETGAGETAKVEASSSGVKYYKIKIKFSEAAQE